MWIVIIGIIVLSGIFNPWTGIFSERYKSNDPEKPEPNHKSFRMTKED